DGSSKNLREILREVGIDDAENHTSINSILPKIENLDVIFFLTQSTSSVTLPVLQSLLDEADKHGVSIIFGDDYYTGSGINHLVNRLGDPEARTQHSNTTNSAGYVVIEENPIFGKAEV
ncbi:hypothetical protein J4G37_54835, partial [Microvirga sp. 3-52]|nr:hypothetical protein [Microvirga sp. 3-52]